MSVGVPVRPNRGWRLLIVVAASLVLLPALPYLLFTAGYIAVPVAFVALAGAVRFVVGPITSIGPDRD